MHVYCTNCVHFIKDCDISNCENCYCKDCQCRNPEDSMDLLIRHKYKAKEGCII